MPAAAMTLTFRDGPHGPSLSAIPNPITGGTVAVAESDFYIVLDGHLHSQADLRHDPATASWACAEAEVAAIWEAHGDRATLTLRVTARRDGVRCDQVGLWRSRIAAPARLGRGERRPPADPLAPVPGVLAAHPIWIGDDVFAGIDWPVAENACAAAAGGTSAILCREFPGVTLTRGQAWHSHSLTIGAASAGALPEAFLRHLAQLRGRPTRRASFYFDWLTHASEGPTEAELEAMVDLMARLRDTYGARFDIYALDDGAVETRWSLYWDRYRLQHRRRFPHGLEGPAHRLQALGTSLGVWIGPDGFGPDGTRPRAADVAAMVRDWNVALLKIDTCVSSPWRDGDPAANDAYLRRFADMLRQARAVRPDLVAINHRVSSSPYVLAMLDSTLWEGAESYPDVFLNNTDRPRLHTRYAAYGRGLPTYYGAASDLLEDHGVCFNGDPAGWRREMCVGAFGRALALSPEVYGTIFSLPDGDYADLATALRLTEEWRPVLARPGRRTAEGDFVHGDGDRAVVCLLNDGWHPVQRELRLGTELGLTAGGGAWSAVARFPMREVLGTGLAWGAQVQVPLAPFEAVAVEIHGGEPAGPWADAPFHAQGGTLVLSGAPGTERQVSVNGTPRTVRFPGRHRADRDWVDLGEWTATTPRPGDEAAAEACRYATSNDPAEWRALREAPPSDLAEVTRCRALFIDKLRHEGMGVAANAWDGDPGTAWGDAPHWRRLENVWRVDLGACAEVAAVEVDLADFGGGPVFRDGERRGLEEPVWLEVSADLARWERAPAHVFYTRNPFRIWPSAVLAECPNGTRGRFVRLRARGFAVRDLRVLTRRAGGDLGYADRTPWRGTNLFGDRPPRTVYRTAVRVRDTWPGRTLAVVATLGDATRLQQEVGHCWARVGGTLQEAVEGSPRPLFHSYEHDAGGFGPGFVWRLPVREPWVGAEATVCLGWLGASGPDGTQLPPPTVHGYILSDHSPQAAVHVRV